MIWSQLYDMEAAHKRRVSVNKIAGIAVEWGLRFLWSCSDELQKRILGIEGNLLTFEEMEKLREELERKLGPLAGKLRFDDRLAFALPQPVKQTIREEAERHNMSMSEIARARIMPRGRKE